MSMTNNPETLRRIEDMLSDIGAPSPAAALNQHQQTAKASSRAVVKQMQQRDCLAADIKGGTLIPRLTAKAATPTFIKGASMAGKDAGEKRYLGKGFQPPSSESPGPIYQPAVGFSKGSADGGPSFSFSTSSRMDRSSMSATPGPNGFVPAPSVGRQSESGNPNAPTPAFGKAKRFNDKEFISRTHSKGMHATDTPGPTAYHDDVLRDPRAATVAQAPSAGFAGMANEKVFISKAHPISLGVDSPGPKYACVIDAAVQSRYKQAPSISFPRSTRNGGAASADINLDESELAVARHVRASAATPGPGAYDVTLKRSERAGHSAVFCTAGDEIKRFVSKELSLSKGADSPGMRYSPSWTQQTRHTAAAVLGGGNVESNARANRFSQKEFIGKAFNNNKGSSSPGPAYTLPDFPEGAAYTIVHKEKHFPKKVFPGPSRPRWISQNTAKDNLGAFSPGPKYDITGDISKEGPSFSFSASAGGAANVNLASATSGSHREDGKPPRPPSQTEMQALTNPSDAACSTVKRSTTVRISPAPANVSRVPLDAVRESRAKVAAVKSVVRLGITRADEPNVSFTQAKRWESQAAAAAKATAAGPSPAHYTVKHSLVEKTITGGGFGGLP
jgi:hypothetical protein